MYIIDSELVNRVEPDYTPLIEGAAERIAPIKSVIFVRVLAGRTRHKTINFQEGNM